MPEHERRLERLVERSEDARQARSQIEDWLAGRGSIVALLLAVTLVLALVLGLAHA